jgi:hypothetical protein
MLDGRDLDPGQRDVRAVEVDRDDLLGVGGQVGEDVAAARCDRDEARLGSELEGGHVDRGILPDLRVDQALEGEGEAALQDTSPRGRLVLMNSAPELLLRNRKRAVFHGIS